jgi:hypothetical protein
MMCGRQLKYSLRSQFPIRHYPHFKFDTNINYLLPTLRPLQLWRHMFPREEDIACDIVGLDEAEILRTVKCDDGAATELPVTR